MAKKPQASVKAWQQSDDEDESDFEAPEASIEGSDEEEVGEEEEGEELDQDTAQADEREGPGYAQFLDSDDEDDYDEDEESEEVSEEEAVGDDQADEVDNDRTEKELRKRMEQVPFSVLLKAQRSMKGGNGRRGNGAEDEEDDEEDEFETDRRAFHERQKEKERREIEKRENKHAPTEMSSRRPVSRKRQIVEPAGPGSQSGHLRDPRFSSLSASLPNTGLFRSSYAFLRDQQTDEIKQLRQTLSKLRRQEAHHAGPRATSETALAIREERGRVEQALKREEARDNERRERERKGEVIRKAKKEIDERVKQGGKRFYLKDSEKKKLLLQDKFARLSGGDGAASSRHGSLQRAVQRRRKKNAAKDRVIPLGGGAMGGGGGASSDFSGDASNPFGAGIPKRKRMANASSEQPTHGKQYKRGRRG